MATSLDTEDELKDKYENAMDMVEYLQSKATFGTFCYQLDSGCQTYTWIVLHGVDATHLENTFNSDEVEFDRIIFNFPHSGIPLRTRSKPTSDVTTQDSKEFTSTVYCSSISFLLHITTSRTSERYT